MASSIFGAVTKKPKSVLVTNYYFSKIGDKYFIDRSQKAYEGVGPHPKVIFKTEFLKEKIEIPSGRIWFYGKPGSKNLAVNISQEELRKIVSEFQAKKAAGKMPSFDEVRISSLERDNEKLQKSFDQKQKEIQMHRKQLTEVSSEADSIKAEIEKNKKEIEVLKSKRGGVEERVLMAGIGKYVVGEDF
jgi:prefoldin subunit 5